MKKQTKEQKALDKEISYHWARRASGVPVPMLDIPKIFADCRDAHARGESIESAVDAAVAKYRSAP